ncbi:unnamed protein product [Paramecium octaurelia]|uniref:RING-type E3 ubiquitin transferase n=1 Tax=Paramecium octaurelia TaxID=43137 RepID=A0A8S1YI43_PAROT|nr:unnamed protein product [Paramecium octaurelia]CAD8213088.1 unnamed protein product [Paramecium octaurelia]
MNNQKSDDEKYKKFQCKICLDLATEPVITPCGHLYCWQCIYTWAQKKNPLLCPYCSNVFELDKVTTIFTGDSQESKKSEIPKRPTNPRQEQTNQQQQFGNFQFGFGFGMPFMMMSNFNFGQGQQGNAKGFMLIFFLGFIMMNLLPILNFDFYFPGTSQQSQRRSRRHQDTFDDYFTIFGIGLAITLGFAGLSYLAKRILNK